MGRDRKQGAIGHQQQDQRLEEGDHNRQAWDLRQDERGFVLHDGAGPLNERTGLRLSVMTGLPITTAVEVKAPTLGLFEVEIAGVADKPAHHAHADKQAGRHDEQAGDPVGSSRGVHDTEQIVHEPAFTQEGGHSTEGQEKLSTDACS